MLESWQVAKEHLAKAASKRIEKLNQQRKQRLFEVGDAVWAFIPTAKETKAANAQRKLIRPWQGPFRIIEKLGDATYRVVTNRQRKPHQCLHVSKLKEYRGPWPLPQDPDPNPHYQVQVHTEDLPHGEGIWVEPPDPEIFYEAPVVRAEKIPYREANEEECDALGRAFMDDDGAIMEIFHVSWDPTQKVMMAYCKMIDHVVGPEHLDRAAGRWYSFPEVAIMLREHAVDPKMDTLEAIVEQVDPTANGPIENDEEDDAEYGDAMELDLSPNPGVLEEMAADPEVNEKEG
jgi:hypothetical protein